MFLTILEVGGKITRFWRELTTWTRHVKLPWEKQSRPNSTPVILRVSRWYLLTVIVNQSCRGNSRFLDSEIYRWLSKEYVVQTSFLTDQNLWFQQIFLSKTKKYVYLLIQTTSNSKSPITETKIKYKFYRKTPNKRILN